uniref:Macaca fascicularis brain cDNA clone: QflA-22065, similar to human similar to KIAA0563 gene product (LOC387646), misc RNA, RefSeq: XR_000212.1 n=1 Tax=Macaca fascicularis TaxID=9541 RepID=I7GIR8_MACFA|nr:unnamed protein product [Macaca fascicularis]
MPLLSKAASGSIVSSVLRCFFWACNTFMNAPSGFPTDASSAVKKVETALILKDDGTACISPQLYTPVTQSRSQQTFECHSKRRNIHPILNL